VEIETYFNPGDPLGRIEKLWIDTEYIKFNDINNTRKLYEELTKKIGTNTILWLSYIDFEIKQDDYLTAGQLFKSNYKRHLDNPLKFLNKWDEFNQKYSDLKTYYENQYLIEIHKQKLEDNGIYDENPTYEYMYQQYYQYQQLQKHRESKQKDKDNNNDLNGIKRKNENEEDNDNKNKPNKKRKVNKHEKNPVEKKHKDGISNNKNTVEIIEEEKEESQENHDNSNENTDNMEIEELKEKNTEKKPMLEFKKPEKEKQKAEIDLKTNAEEETKKLKVFEQTLERSKKLLDNIATNRGVSPENWAEYSQAQDIVATISNKVEEQKRNAATN